MKTVEIRDLCDRVEALLLCLGMVMETNDFKDYLRKPHMYLLETISENVRGIQKLASEVVADEY